MLDFVSPLIMNLEITFVLFQDDKLGMTNDLDNLQHFVHFVLENAKLLIAVFTNLVSRDFVGRRRPRRHCLFCITGWRCRRGILWCCVVLCFTLGSVIICFCSRFLFIRFVAGTTLGSFLTRGNTCITLRECLS